MPKETLLESHDNNIKRIYVYDESNPQNRTLVYEIDIQKEIIKMYSTDLFSIKDITIEGFNKLPDCFDEKGYIKAGASYYINKRLSTKDVDKLVISKFKKDDFHDNTLVLSYSSLSKLVDKLKYISSESKRERSLFVDEFFHLIFPDLFEEVTYSSRSRKKKVIENLDEEIIKHFEPDDLIKLEEFYSKLLELRYQNKNTKLKLVQRTKIKVDNITLKYVIEEFEDKLSKGVLESEWGDFLQKHLYLLNSKYTRCIPELNVVLGGDRRVDFGLIDLYSYLDIFEIKKPETRILSEKTDRGNYYWHNETVKALTQAEKYLFNAERKGANLSEDIKREKGLDVYIVKPRAIVMLGHSNQLINDNMKLDFRILRSSLKNVEILTYDELLEQLKNQLLKVYN
ncbi:DUF4263 domain-containing protein [Heliobacterium undosum]|uniref:DUF4263 domain-containing protein n=1 Tax=Heliomicrobium undosum TaxID=121734 RepID=A0A845L2L4_9FIRM|nr:Shedu immune nuclease family protein [Heliomicrobium undosum]MZP30832.1 DUF4263 domain-containing protein [Heliomicrobium undosum]